MAFGKYPDITLAEAREKRAAARKLLEQDVDPSQAKRIDKINKAAANANTFEAIAREWHTNKQDSWQERTATNILHRLEKDVFPLIGKLPITDIKAPVMLDVLRQIEKRGALEMARRQGQVRGQVFRFAIAIGRADNDPVPALRGALKPISKGHHAAISAEAARAPARIREDRRSHVRADESHVPVDDDDVRPHQRIDGDAVVRNRP